MAKKDKTAEYAAYIEELKFAFVHEALVQGKPRNMAALGGGIALLEAFEHEARFVVKMMQSDVGVACRDFVAEGETLIRQYRKKQRRATFIQGTSDYLEKNFTKHFDDLDHIIKLRWFASLMIAIENRDYDRLKNEFASHFDIDPENPTAPYQAPAGQPTALREKIVLALVEQKAGSR